MIIGLENGEHGFPSNVSDDHVMRMVLTQGDAFPYGEERRLFYLAMTRARSRTYLVAPHHAVSPFGAGDLLGIELKRYAEVVRATSPRDRCPRCKGKTIRWQQGSHGAFSACTNFPICHGKLRRCPTCRDGAMVVTELSATCSQCGHAEFPCPRYLQGMLVHRINRATGQPFWACSLWHGETGCNLTQNMPPLLPAPRQRQHLSSAPTGSRS